MAVAKPERETSTDPRMGLHVIRVPRLILTVRTVPRLMFEFIAANIRASS